MSHPKMLDCGLFGPNRSRIRLTFACGCGNVSCLFAYVYMEFRLGHRRRGRLRSKKSFYWDESRKSFRYWDEGGATVWFVKGQGKADGGKDGGKAALENAGAFPTFPTIPTTAGDI
ncbi:MAG: hypothetical protein LAO20_16835 [Acidobacteriia bacterium]|nr:hypothetical protein [Terriglobia bacterium]